MTHYYISWYTKLMWVAFWCLLRSSLFSVLKTSKVNQLQFYTLHIKVLKFKYYSYIIFLAMHIRRIIRIALNWFKMYFRIDDRIRLVLNMMSYKIISRKTKWYISTNGAVDGTEKAITKQNDVHYPQRKCVCVIMVTLIQHHGLQ